jgi:microcin C transport system permease protein
MVNYIIRRLLLMVLTLVGISLVVFTLTRALPGGPLEQYLSRVASVQTMGGAENQGTQLSEAELEALREYFDQDDPVYLAYFKWVGKMCVGDFGESYSRRKPALEVIVSKMPISLFFGITSLIVAYAISVPLGVSKALKNGSAWDTGSSVLVLVGYVIPGFALGVLLIVLFGGGQYLDIFPSGGMTSDDFDLLPWHWKALDFLWHMVLPLICFMVGQFAFLTLLMKNTMLEELNKDYLKTALAKGISYRGAVWRHAFRNSLIPLVTGMPAIFTILFTGSLLIEKVFQIDGMGLLMWESMVSRDYKVVLGVIMLSSILALIGRLVSDLMYVIVDPRIRLD